MFRFEGLVTQVITIADIIFAIRYLWPYGSVIGA